MTARDVAFRLGLAGAGRMGRTHLRALAGSEAVTVAAVAEPVQPAREQLAGWGIPVHDSVMQMIEKASLDGVLICTPTDTHGGVIAEIAAAGLPVLCEKPCGVSAEQARSAAAAAEAAGVLLQVAYWRRYVPGLRDLRARILGGGLGFVHLISCFQWDASPPSAAFRLRSGGIMVDMGVHEFDQLRWLSGQEIETVSAVAAGFDRTGDPDSAQVLMELSGGSAGLVSLGRWHPAGDMARAEVFGTAGTAYCPFLDPEDGEQAQLAALRAQAEDFARRARGEAAGGRPTGGVGADGARGTQPASAVDAVAALEAAERAYSAMAAAAGSARHRVAHGADEQLGPDFDVVP
jgi:myo-inositol 2-dehydrogenase / D-chiro-inositol 1-dehydrogenase